MLNNYYNLTTYNSSLLDLPSVVNLLSPITNPLLNSSIHSVIEKTASTILALSSCLPRIVEKYTTFPGARAFSISDHSSEDIFETLHKKAHQLSSSIFGPLGLFETNPSPLINMSELLAKLDSRMFAHIHGDAFIKGSNLEGSHVETIANFLSLYAPNLPSKISSIITDITTKIHFIPGGSTPEAFGNELAKKAQNLSENESLWINGGWVPGGRAPGHAMLYELVKRGNNSYDFMIYNTGAGIEYHSMEVNRLDHIDTDTPQLTSVHPVLTFRGLFPQHLGIDPRKPIDPSFFVRLLQLQKTEIGDLSNEKKIYEEVLGPFNAYREANPKTSNLYFFSILPQQSGICAFKSVDASIYKKIVEHPELTNLDYHLFKFKLKDDTFYLFCNKEQIEESLKNGEDRRELCTQSGRKLLRKVINLYNSFASNEQVAKYREKLQAHLSFIQGLAPKYAPINSLSPSPLIYLGKPTERTVTHPIKKPKTTDEKIKPATVFFSTQIPETRNPAKLILELRKILDFPLAEQYPEDVTLQIERLTKALPNPSELSVVWSEASLKQQKELQHLFLETLRSYTNIILASNNRLFIHQLTAWNILAAIHAISCQIIPDLTNYGIFYASFERLIEDPKFTNFDKEDLQRYKDLLSYFQTVKKEGKQLFNASEKIDITEKSPVFPEETLLSPIVESDPDLVKEVRELGMELIENPDSPTHPIVGKKAAYLLFSQQNWGKHPKITPIANLAKAARISQGFIQLSSLTINEYLKKIHPHIESVQTTRPQRNHPKTFTIYSISQRWTDIDKGWQIPSEDNAFHKELLKENANEPHIFHKTKNHKLAENDIVAQGPWDREGQPEYFWSSGDRSGVSPAVYSKNAIDSRLGSSTCIKSLQSYKILSYFTENISMLSRERAQNILLLALFQSLRDRENNTEIAPLHSALENPDFIDLASKFINKGLNTYKKTNPSICLFFIQVARRLEELGANLQTPNLHQEINSWLLDPNLSKEKKAQLHLHRILQYIPHKNQLSASELQEIVISWLYLRQVESKDDFASWHSFHSREEASKFLFSLAPMLEKCSSEFVTACLNQALVLTGNYINLETFPNKKQIGPRYIYNINQEDSWSFYLPFRSILGFVPKEEDKWDIDLLHGDIYHNDKRIYLGIQNPVTESSVYKELFKDQKFPLNRENNIVFFSDENQRMFRTFEIDGYKNFAIQIQFHGDWLEYIPESELKKTLGNKQIPYPLLADHYVFASNSRMVFINKKTKAIDFSYTPEGKLVDSEENPVAYTNDLIFSSSIEQFEKRLWIVASQKGSDLDEISFPRFRSVNGDPLNFIATKEGILWKDQGIPEFLIKEPPQGLLGLCKNYLFLQNKQKTKQKILVPMKPVLEIKDFNPHCELDIEDKFRKIDYKTGAKDELLLEQNSAYSFLEYDVIDNIVVPLNREGALFLIYIFLAQKDYKKAIEILTQDLSLKKHLEITPLLQTILDRIIQLPLSSSDQSATSAAIALKTSLFLLRDVRKNLGRASSEKLAEQLPSLWQAYFTGLDNVPQNMRLSLIDLREIQYLSNILSIPLNPPTHTKSLHPEPFPQGYISNNYQAMEEEYKKYPAHDVKSFVACYNAFIKASSNEEIAFIKMKFGKYLRPENVGSEKPEYIKAVLRQVSVYPKKHFPECSAETNLELFHWVLNNFTPDHVSSSFLIPPSSPSIAALNPKPIVKLPSIAETLNKVRSSNIPQPFKLDDILLQECDSLKMFQEKYLIATQQRPSSISLDIDKQKIPDLYVSAVKAELANFVQDLEKGKEKKQAESFFSLKEGTSVTELHREIKTHLETLNQEVSSLKTQILDLLHKLPSDPKQKELTLLLEQGHVKSPVDIERAVTAFLEGNSEAYTDINSHLTEEDLRRLDVAIGDFLRLSIKSSHAKRALSVKDPDALGQILSEETAYNLEKYASLVRLFLVYEHRAGIKLRRNQVELIHKMLETNETGQYKNSVGQLIMGGGKTSVLATILLHLAAKPGRIPIFIAPSAQYTTLKENLGNTQKQYFFRDIIPFQFKRSDLTAHNLLWMLEQFEEAKQGRGILLSTSETLESLQLEFLSLLDEKERGPLTQDLVLKAQYLAKILIDLKNRGDALIDEVDLILNPLRETNFPTGEKQLVNPTSVKLAKHIFSLLIKPKFQEKLQLQENKQGSLEEKGYKAILKEVASDLLDTYPDLKIPPAHKQVALEYILDKGKSHELLQNLTIGDFEKELLALAKHLISSILPLTLSKSSGQHYGRVLKGEKVIPYLGVDTPASTEIGEPWEAVSYHFQTALSKGVEISQLRDFGKGLFESAIYFATLYDIDMEETADNKLFQKITGISLRDLDNQEKLQQAVDYVNTNAENQLMLEANTICQLVGSYLSYVRSNSQSFIEQIATKRGFSGTPGNGVLNPKSLQDHIYLDAGTEGRIAYEFLERAKQNPHSIHLISSTDVQSALDSILEKMDKERKNRLNGFIDSAGFFKETSNYLVAKNILQYYKKDPRIQTVLYFGRSPENPTGAAVLMAIKKGSEDKPIIIGSTQKTEIAKYGIDPTSTFVYYDEYHCEATDIVQKSDAINAISVGHKTTLRTFLQGMLRNRGYLGKGDLEYVIKKEEADLFSQSTQTPTHEQIILKTVHNQAIRIADLAFRTYKQKVDNALRQVALNLILESTDVTEQQALMKQFRDVLVVTNSASPPFETAEMQDTLQVMSNYRKKQESLFQNLTSNVQLHKDVKKRLDEISISSYLPLQVKNLEKSNIESQIEVFLQQETQKELSQEIEQQIEQELQQELQSYQTQDRINSFKEVLWDPYKLHECCKPVPYEYGPLRPTVHLLQELLKPNPHIHFTYPRQYFKLFSENLQISNNFAHTLVKLQPVFSKKQKHAEQILITKENGQLKATMISSLEAKCFKEHIEKTQPSDVWLLLPDGHSYVKNPIKMTPQESEELKNLLWQVNLFNGNVKALLQSEITPVMIEFLDKQLLFRFLSLKSEYNPTQKAIFQNSQNLFSGKQPTPESYVQAVLKEPLHVKIRKLSDLGDLEPHLFQYLSIEQVQEIDPKYLENLIDIQIPFLKPDRFSKLTKPSHIRQVPLEHINRLLPSQYKYLSQEQNRVLKSRKIQ